MTDPKIMDEKSKKAFDFAKDTATQLITLSTGIIVIVITFAKDVVKNADSHGCARFFMALACGVYLLSILAGLWHLLALTGELEQTGSTQHTPTIRGSNATIPSLAQIALFLIATLLIIVYGVLSL